MTVRDAQRHTTKLQLRLPPDLAREIRALSASSGVPVSTLVALAWAVARRGGLDAALATVARAAGRPLAWRAHVASLHDLRGLMPAKIWDGLMAELMAEAPK